MTTKPIKYFLATYELLDGEHEHNGAFIIEAITRQEAEKIATDEEHSPETHYTAEDREQGRFKYFDFGGDATTAARNRGINEITEQEMRFLERVGLAYRR
jgi:hypothetical protein